MATATETMTALDEAILKGVGGSQGPTYRGLAGTMPLQIKDLIANPVRFRKQEAKLDSAHEIPYQPINAKPLQNDGDASASASLTPTTTGPPKSPQKKSSLAGSVASASAPAPSPSPKLSPTNKASTSKELKLFPAITPNSTWAQQHNVGAGLHNLGNTCFLNSALQVLLHTPPLVRYLEDDKHNPAQCQFRETKKFCMICSLQLAVKHSFSGKRSYSPSLIVNNMRKIASHFRLGRQEDAHEFLRFSIDNMQLSALFGTSPKLDQRIKDSTFVHQIFGGRLRSRVTCEACGHASDTFDSVLDLSLDVHKLSSLREALDRFVKTDSLRGANKYKCEKCKKLVNAEKGFTIDHAPMVLMIHLKRFTPTGRKIGDTIKYPETLRLGEYMSDPSTNPTYRLYGVINHSGGGPHSGHYTANVKSANGSWFHMNDELVSGSGSTAPLHQRQAYILAYCRDQAEVAQTAVRSNAAMRNGATVNGKRPREDLGSPVQNGVAKKRTLLSQEGPRPPLVVAASQQAKRPVPEVVVPIRVPFAAKPEQAESNEEEGADDEEETTKTTSSSPAPPTFMNGSKPGSGVFLDRSMMNGNGMSSPKKKKLLKGKLQISAVGEFGKKRGGLVDKMKGKSGANGVFGRPKVLRG